MLQSQCFGATWAKSYKPFVGDHEKSIAGKTIMYLLWTLKKSVAGKNYHVYVGDDEKERRN